MFALAVMFVGILLGFLLRGTRLPALASRLVMPAIIILLFFMGLGIGANHRLMDNLPTLGLRGLLLTLAALAGSLTVVCLLRRFLPSPGASAKWKNSSRQTEKKTTGESQVWHEK